MPYERSARVRMTVLVLNQNYEPLTVARVPRKAARTPEEARMPLKRIPSEPRIASYLHARGIDTRPEWCRSSPSPHRSTKHRGSMLPT